MRRIFLLLGLMMTLAAAGRAEAPVFRQALPGYHYQFPRDFYSHDDYRIEWWYYTGNLEAASGRSFGYQLTFFRVALDPRALADNPSLWRLDQVYFAHLTVSDLDNERFYFFERINRPALGLAGAASDALRVWNEDWVLSGQGPAHHLTALEQGTGIDLNLVPAKPLVIHGAGGVSQKGPEPGNASHYFSFTRMNTTGTVSVRGRPYRVTGTSWMDHEYSSNQLNPDQVGWDWFSIKLDNNTELMLYQIRLKGGGIDPYSSGTFVDSRGRGHPIRRGAFQVRATGRWTSPHTGTVYPSGWEIQVPGKGVRLMVRPMMEDQELHALRSINQAYWEGSVRVEGEAAGESVTGKGYVELVGYGRPLRQTLPPAVGAE